MIDSYKFLEKRLRELFTQFPKSNIRYEFISNRLTHLIEITPLSFYHSDRYKQSETDLEDEFELMFPKENILFISDESLNKINEPNLELFSEIHGRFCLLSGNSTQSATYSFLNFSPEFVGEDNYALAA
jgi:hypothetical protein